MDQQLKQRLIGASVVVALAVIVVPELIKQQPEEASPAAVSAIPPRPVMAASSPLPEPAEQATVLVLPGAEPAQAPSQTIEPSPPSSELGEQLIPKSAVPEQVVLEAIEPKQTESQAVSEPVASESAAPVQSAAESQKPKPTTAKSTTASPAQRSQSAKSSRPESRPESRPKSRPEPKKSSPKVAEPAPVARPASKSPAVELPKIQLISRAQYDNTQPSQKVSKDPRWMVQAGSFYIVENASMLRAKLRQQKFPATMQTAVVEGRTVYRVQVGPHATRAEGERTKVRLLQDAGIKGSVVPVYN